MSLVCAHSGVCCQLCEFSCPRCEHSYIGCPDLERIRVACQAIRGTWTEAQLARAEGRDEEMEIPTATLVWDGMRRKAGEWD